MDFQAESRCQVYEAVMNRDILFHLQVSNYTLLSEERISNWTKHIWWFFMNQAVKCLQVPGIMEAESAKK